jgi:hypothetical protein
MSLTPFPAQVPWSDTNPWKGLPSQTFKQYLSAIDAQVRKIPVTFSQLPAAVGNLGMTFVVTDSNTNVWGAAVAGGGANTVLVWSNGTNWTVIGK